MPVQFYLFTRTDKLGDHPINVSISLFGERLCTPVGYTSPQTNGTTKLSVGRKTHTIQKNKINEKLTEINSLKYKLEEQARRQTINEDEIRNLGNKLEESHEKM
jgi:hypothetical protein